MSRPRELALSKMSRWVGDLVAARRVTPWQPDGRLVLECTRLRRSYGLGAALCRWQAEQHRRGGLLFCSSTEQGGRAASPRGAPFTSSVCSSSFLSARKPRQTLMGCCSRAAATSIVPRRAWRWCAANHWLAVIQCTLKSKSEAVFALYVVNRWYGI